VGCEWAGMHVSEQLVAQRLWHHRHPVGPGPDFGGRRWAALTKVCDPPKTGHAGLPGKDYSPDNMDFTGPRISSSSCNLATSASVISGAISSKRTDQGPTAASASPFHRPRECALADRNIVYKRAGINHLHWNVTGRVCAQQYNRIRQMFRSIEPGCPRSA